MLRPKLIQATGAGTSEVVEGVSSTSAAGNFSIDFSSLFVQSGDLLMVFAITDNEGEPNPGTPTGWTQVQYNNPTGITYALWRKSATGSDSFTTTALLAGEWDATSIVGVRVQAGTYAAFGAQYEASSLPDPPSLGSFNSGTDICLAFGGIQNRDVSLTAPSGFTIASTASITSGADATSAACAYRVANAATIDPGTFGNTTATTSVGYTVRVTM